MKNYLKKTIHWLFKEDVGGYFIFASNVFISLVCCEWSAVAAWICVLGYFHLYLKKKEQLTTACQTLIDITELIRRANASTAKSPAKNSQGLHEN